MALPLGSAINEDEDGEPDGGEVTDDAPGTVCSPDTFGTAGIRGKENSSLIGGNTAAVAGDALLSASDGVAIELVATGAVETDPIEPGTAFASAPPGAAVGAEAGIPDTPTNENISFPGGSVGATAIGEIFPSRKRSGCEVGAADVVAVGAPGTRDVALPNDAAIARRSASESGPGCAAVGEPDGPELGDATGVS